MIVSRPSPNVALPTEKGLVIEDQIIGHISFDIYHLTFEDLRLLKQMTNDKCQMIYGKCLMLPEYTLDRV